MTTSPEFLPPEPAYLTDDAPPHIRHIPNIGHTLLFLAIGGVSMLLVQLLAFGLAVGLHLFGHETNAQLMRDPRLLIPAMFLSYLVTGLVSIVVFSTIWRRPFADGVRWDLAPVRRRPWLLIGTGVVVSIAVQLLSNFLPIPKELPIDDFFRTPLDIWMVAIFGVFIAPIFEELAFRGFLLPSLATSWDWITRERVAPAVLGPNVLAPNALDPKVHARTDYAPLETLAPLRAFAPIEDQKWSTAAVIFASTITSICFALLHADQLAHAWAPLGVLFCVSLVLCAVRLRYHSMAASALVHACYNGAIFGLLFIATSGFRHLDKLKQ